MKLVNSLLKEKIRVFKRDLAYEKWLNDFIGVPSNKELNLMEKSLNSKKIKPFNNVYYNPLQGA